MKSAKIEMPSRLYKKMKMWLLDCNHQQSEMFCYLIDNLPAPPQLKPNSRLDTYLKVYDNQISIKKQYGTEILKTLELISKGLIVATTDEQKIIDKLIGPAPK